VTAKRGAPNANIVSNARVNEVRQKKDKIRVGRGPQEARNGRVFVEVEVCRSRRF
jgi:hypothetical protein